MSYAYYNDIDGFCCNVLRKNIDRGYLPGGKVDEKDIRDVDAADFMGYQHIHLFAGIGAFPLGFEWAGYPSSIRTFTGGFPCTDVSNAGKRAGITGSQSGLWKEMYHLIQEAMDSGMGPDIVILENVSALIHRGLSTVLGDLAEIGMDARWRVLRGSDFGAPHQRERIFIVAYPESREDRRVQQRGIPTNSLAENPDVAHTNSQRCQECNTTSGNTGMGQCARRTETYGASREPQRRLGGMFTGLPAGMDRPQRWPARPGETQHSWEPPRTVVSKQPDRAKRLKSLGNSIVPQCVHYVALQVMESLALA